VAGRVVTGATFAAVGLLLLLDAWDVIELAAGIIPAVLLVGLGLSLLTGRRSEE
jgi:hypothetical protein